MPAPQLPFVLQAWIRTLESGAAKISPVWCVREIFCGAALENVGGGVGFDVGDIFGEMNRHNFL